jgi:hypothetical protein
MAYNVMSFLGKRDPHGGKYFIPQERYSLFLKQYTSALASGQPLYLAESYQQQPYRWGCCCTAVCLRTACRCSGATSLQLLDLGNAVVDSLLCSCMPAAYLVVSSDCCLKAAPCTATAPLAHATPRSRACTKQRRLCVKMGPVLGNPIFRHSDMANAPGPSPAHHTARTP